MEKQNERAENNYEESLLQHYQPVEMSEEFRRALQLKTRTVVAARRRASLFRWVAGLVGAAALLAVVVLVWHFVMVATPNDRVKTAPIVFAQAPKTEEHETSGHFKATPSQQPETHPEPHRGVPTYNGTPLLEVISLTQPVTDGKGGMLAVGEKLPVGSVIHTGRHARLALVTRQGSELHLDADSTLTLATATIATLSRGRLYCSNHDKEFTRIDTPAGHVRLLGTVVDTAVVRPDAVAVTVVEGKVQLSNAHGEALVAAGTRAVLTADQHPQAGVPVNTYRETAWYHGQGDIQSDDGDIAYSVQRTGPLTEVWTMKADGSGKHRVRSFLGDWTQLGQWMPGERLIPVSVMPTHWQSPLSNFTPKFDTAIVGNTDWWLNVKTGKSIAPLPAGYSVSYQSFSPDATRLAFSGGGKAEGSGVFVYDRQTARVSRVLQGDIKTEIAWAPDSRHLAVSTGVGYTVNHHLVIIDTDTGAIRDLGIDGAGASFSPDGKHLAYSADFKQYEQGGSWFNGVPMAGSIFTLDLTRSAAPLRISPKEDEAMWPRWSPDGSRLLYLTQKGNGLCVVNADGTSRKTIYRQEGSNTIQAAWDPSGDAVYIYRSGAIPSANQILRVKADGSGSHEYCTIRPQDSALSPERERQTRAAIADTNRALSDYARGCIQCFAGHFSESRAHFTAAAGLFAQLVWAHPLAGLQTEDTLRFADAARNRANASEEEMVKECCRERMAQLPWLLMARLQHDRCFPSKLSAVTQRGLTECPAGKGHSPLPFVYTPPSAPGVTPHVGDVLVCCPLDPAIHIAWTERMEGEFNQRLLDQRKPGQYWPRISVRFFMIPMNHACVPRACPIALQQSAGNR